MENKKKFSKKILLGVIGIVGVLVVIIVCGVLFSNENDALRFKREYEKLNGVVREKDKQTTRTIKIAKDNPFIYQNEEDIIKRIDNKETFAVYFGFADCPWCRSVVPTLVDVARDMKVDVIYYVDVKDIRNTVEVNDDGEIIITKEGSDGYKQLLEKLNQVLKDYTLRDKNAKEVYTGLKRIYAPSLIVVSYGEAEVLETGISSLETNAFMELTDEMIKETYDTSKTALEKLNGDGGVCVPDTGC